MGAVLDIFGANKAAKAQTKAAEQAAKASQYATDQSLAYQREIDNRIWGATEGARNLGNTAIGKLQGLTDGTMDPTAWLESTPGYQANLNAGQRQINASAAAKGGLLSGAAAKEGLRYGADYATGIYNTERNALMAAAGLGQTATNTGAQVGQGAANASQNALYQNAGNLASSYNQRADAKAGFWGTMVGNLGSNAMANYAGQFAKGFKGF